MRWKLYLYSLFVFMVLPAQAVEVKEHYRVAILDRFFPPPEGFQDPEQREQHLALYGMMDIDDDDQKEPFYHGDLVRMLAMDRRITFFAYPIQGGSRPMAEILRNLRKIRVRLETQPVDALLLSWESSTLISTFGQPLRIQNANEYKRQVKKLGESSVVWRNTYAIIEELERLVAKGVDVYTIAGNGGRNMINTFSLAEGVTTVGAIEDELNHFVANNVFVDTYARAAYQLTRVDSASGQPLGYDIDGDKCVDIPLQQLTGYLPDAAKGEYPGTFWKVLRGSSFAAPAALKIALTRQDKTSCS